MRFSQLDTAVQNDVSVFLDKPISVLEKYSVDNLARALRLLRNYVCKEGASQNEKMKSLEERVRIQYYRWKNQGEVVYQKRPKVKKNRPYEGASI